MNIKEMKISNYRKNQSEQDVSQRENITRQSFYCLLPKVKFSIGVEEKPLAPLTSVIEHN